MVPLCIKDVTYFSGAEIEEELGISRQTLYRWRREGKVPLGHVHRKKLIFTEEEFEAIREYANRVEPISISPQKQLKLFNGQKRE